MAMVAFCSAPMAWRIFYWITIKCSRSSCPHRKLQWQQQQPPPQRRQQIRRHCSFLHFSVPAQTVHTFTGHHPRPPQLLQPPWLVPKCLRSTESFSLEGLTMKPLTKKFVIELEFFKVIENLICSYVTTTLNGDKSLIAS